MLVLVLWARHPWAPARHAAPRQRLDATPPVLVAAPAPWPQMATGCACGVQSGEHKLWCQPAVLDWSARNELPPPVERTDGGSAEPGEWFELTLHELAPDGLVGPPTRRLIDDLPREDGMAGDGTPGCPRAVPGGAGDESEGYGLTAPPAPPCCDDPYGTHAIEAWHAGGFKVTWDGQPAPAELGAFAMRPKVPVELCPCGKPIHHTEFCYEAPTRRASATEVANAHADAFMVKMRADHAVWMAEARERWAAA